MITNHIARQVGATVQLRINNLKIGQKMQDLPEELWHRSFRFYVKEDPTREGGPNLRMLRLHPDRPSPTVTGYVFNKFVHPYENRFITVREAARLQGFPDNLKFEGSLTSTQLQVGNAVPIQLAQAVFETILCSAVKFGFTEQSLTALSLFSGAGGMDIASEQAHFNRLKIKTKLALDNWAAACHTLQGYYEQRSTVVNEDILQVSDPLQFWLKYTNNAKLPDLIYGGPPCQAFSQAGKQKGTADERGQLVFEFLRFIEKLKPNFFIMENVSNLRGVGGGSLYQQIMERMSSLGYNVTVGTLLAANFGSPQLRRRLIFLGCHREIGLLGPGRI